MRIVLKAITPLGKVTGSSQQRRLWGWRAGCHALPPAEILLPTAGPAHNSTYMREAPPTTIAGNLHKAKGPSQSFCQLHRGALPALECITPTYNAKRYFKVFNRNRPVSPSERFCHGGGRLDEPAGVKGSMAPVFPTLTHLRLRVHPGSSFLQERDPAGPAGLSRQMESGRSTGTEHFPF